MQHLLRFRTSACVILVLTSLLSLSVAGKPPRPVPQVRVVYVTDSLCGVEGLAKANPHSETLACLAKGAHLQLYDRQRGTLYEIRYASEELRIELQNDYSGLDVNAQGIWDDAKGQVKLQRISPFRDPASRRIRDAE